MRSRVPPAQSALTATPGSRAQFERDVSNKQRSGAVTIWLIIAAPALLLLMVLVSDLANIWVARMELEHALEAAALAAVRQWANGSSITDSRNAGVEFALANNVRGIPLVITPNGGGAPPNENFSCSGNLVFGEIQVDTAQFDAGTDPGVRFGVKAQATQQVLSLWKPIFGLQPYYVSAQTYAYRNFDLGTPPQLVRITTEICP